jgi:hypothetical protein
MLSTIDHYVIGRESNVVRVDFKREPDPPAPCFPGANGLRLVDSGHEGAATPSPTIFAPHVWQIKKFGCASRSTRRHDQLRAP